MRSLTSGVVSNVVSNVVSSTVGTGGDAPLLFTGAITLALLGDSITDQDSGVNSAAAFATGNGYITWLGNLSSNRYLLPQSPTDYNKGVSGNQTSQMNSRKVTDLGPLNFNMLSFMGGVNDITNSTALASIQSNVTSILNYVLVTKAVPYVLIWSVMPNAFPGAWDATMKQKRLDLNAWYATLPAVYPGKVFFINTDSVFVDGITGDPIAGYTVDGLHPNQVGAYVLGKYGANQLRSLFGNGANPFAIAGLLTNSSLSGTTGTVGSNTTGTVATGFTSTASESGNTFSKNADGSQRISFTKTGGSNNGNRGLTQAISTGYANNDVVYAVAKVRHNALVQNCHECRLELILAGTGIQSFTTVVGNQSFGYGNIVECTDPNTGEYYFVTPDMPLTNIGTGSTLTAKVMIYSNSSSGATSSAELDVIQMDIFKR